MTLADIWMADLLACMDALAPADDRARDAIAYLLGFKRTAGSAARPSPAGSPMRGVADTGDEPLASALATSPLLAEDLPAIAPRANPGRHRVPVAPLQLMAVISDSPPTPVSLLSPLARRFIVQELVASNRFGPDPDISRLVDFLARCEIPQAVPLQERRTLARGVQVLIDDGEGMEPFADDQQGMADLVRRLVGDALVDVRRIHEAPDPDDPVEPWEPPPPGTPVLALTDLGLAGRVERGTAELIAAWQFTAGTLAARGSGLAALIPYPTARWPALLTACMRLVHWDRTTTTAQARRASAFNARSGPVPVPSVYVHQRLATSTYARRLWHTGPFI
jgi:hypothetical protein